MTKHIFNVDWWCTNHVLECSQVTTFTNFGEAMCQMWTPIDPKVSLWIWEFSKKSFFLMKNKILPIHHLLILGWFKVKKQLESNVFWYQNDLRINKWLIGRILFFIKKKWFFGKFSNPKADFGIHRGPHFTQSLSKICECCDFGPL